jgi:hypothetical protein
MCQLLLSDVGYVPTPNVHSDEWDHVESYTIYMLLAYRLKITFTFSLKLIISFLVQLQHLSFTFSNSHFFSGQSRHTSSSSIMLYLWLGARRPTTMQKYKGSLVASLEAQRDLTEVYGSEFCNLETLAR